MAHTQQVSKMSKQVNTTEVKSVLSKTAHSAIISAYCTALDSVENNASIVTQVCNAARGYLKGEPMSKPDADAVISGIAQRRGWKGDAVKTRGSEVRTVLNVYNTLPEAVEQFRKREGACTWHMMVTIARKLRTHNGNVNKAVKAAAEGAGESSKPVNPAGRVAGALKAWYANVRGDKREAIRKAVSILSTAGLKLELE